MKNERVSIAIASSVKDEWQKMADEKGMSLSTFIRHAVTVYVTAMKSSKKQ